VVDRYTDGFINVEAIQFKRTEWKNIRRFAGKNIYKMVVPGCQNESATCLLKTKREILTVTEGEWIAKGDGFFVCEAKVFSKTYKKIDG